MNEHKKKPRQDGGDPNRPDEPNKETEATPDTETEIGKAEQMGERFKKPA